GIRDSSVTGVQTCALPILLSEELGLQKLLEGREGRACSGSARQFVPPTWNYLKILDCRTCTDGSATRRSLDERSIPVWSFYLFYDDTVPRRIMTIGLHVKRNC